MALIDVKDVQEQVTKELREEAMTKAKTKLKAQMRIIADAEAIVTAEKRKLDDILATIGEG